MIEGMTLWTKEEGPGGTAYHPGTTVDLHLELHGGIERLLETKDLTIEMYALIRKKWVDYREREMGTERPHPEMLERLGLGDQEVNCLMDLLSIPV